MKFFRHAMIAFRVAAVSLVLITAGCGDGALTGDGRSATSVRIIMDTYVSVTIHDAPLPHRDRMADIRAAFSVMERIEEAISSHIASSDIAAVNAAAGVSPIRVGPDALKILRHAQRLSAISGGDFDVTVKPLMNLWDFTGDHPRLPPEEAIARLLPWVDYRLLTISGDSVRLAHRGMGIDLGGIGKGYAVDRCVALLQGYGYRHIVANAGGDLLIANRTGRPHSIGIRHPWATAPDSIIASYQFTAGGIATSGNYERSFEVDGIRYHHLLNPHNGYPARGAISATVLARDVMTADALATVVFIKGPEAGIAFLDSIAGVEGVVFYEEDGQLRDRVTSGMRDTYSYARTDGGT